MKNNLQKTDITELKPRINVFGVGGGGGNAVNNMINAGLQGVEFVVANTDAQALATSKAERVIQLGAAVTEGLGAGSHPEVGRAAAEECLDEIVDHLINYNMVFVTAGMGGGTGTGAAPIIARAAREKGLLTVGVVTKPFDFEGQRRMKTAESGIEELQKNVDTLIVIPNQNLFRIANEKTTFADAFAMADQVLYSGVASITDLMVREGLINLDFADVRSVMINMGKAMMGTGEASEEGRALAAAEAAISNPLLDESSVRGARGLLISVTGGRDMTLFEVDQATTRIRNEVDPEANLIFGAIIDSDLEGLIRVSVVATGIDRTAHEAHHNETSAVKMDKLSEEVKNRHVSATEDHFFPHSQIFGKGSSSQHIGLEDDQRELAARMEKNDHRSTISHAHLQQSVLQSGFGQQLPHSAPSMSSFKRPVHNRTEPYSHPIEQADISAADQSMRCAPADNSSIKTHTNYGCQEHEVFRKQHDSTHNPRNFWKKIQNFIYPEDEDQTAHLEQTKEKKTDLPNFYKKREEDFLNTPLDPNSSVQSTYRHSPHPQNTASYGGRKVVDNGKIHSHIAADATDDEEKLEIPSFLRRM